MKYPVILLSVLFLACSGSAEQTTNGAKNLSGDTLKKTKTNVMESIHSFTVKDITGKDFSFASLKGKKVMIVNTASECGLTPQYENLQYIYDQFKDSNFVIVGFPANNFGSQEPGTNEEIAQFCSANFKVSFPMMEKVSVKDTAIAPIYQWLTQKEKNGVEDCEMIWNFQKFLIDEEGHFVRNVHPRVLPDDASIISWIKSKKQ